MISSDYRGYLTVVDLEKKIISQKNLLDDLKVGILLDLFTKSFCFKLSSLFSISEKWSSNKNPSFNYIYEITLKIFFGKISFSVCSLVNLPKLINNTACICEM